MAASNDDCTGQCPNNECFDIIKTKKTYQIPCRKNVREAYTVEVPKTTAYTVNKQVPYIEYEPRMKQVPYQYFDYQTRVRNVPTCRPVTRICTPINMRCQRKVRPRYAKKKCPRTVYIKNCQPRQICQPIPRMGYRTVQENVPVRKFRTEAEVNYKTETVPEVRYRTKAVTNIVQKTVPVYSIVPNPPAPPGKERVVETVRAPEGISVLPAATTYTGAQSSLIPINVSDARQNGMIYHAQYPLPQQALDLNYKRSTNPEFLGQYTDMDPNYGRYMGNIAIDLQSKNENTVTIQPQVNYKTENIPKVGYVSQANIVPMHGTALTPTMKPSFPVEKVTNQAQVNYKTENIPKVGKHSQANIMPMHGIALRPAMSLGEESFVQSNMEPEERTNTAVSHASAVDGQLIPINYSELERAMARSSVPREKSTVTTNYGEHMEQGQKIGSIDTNRGHIKNDPKLNFQKVTVGSKNFEVPRAGKYKQVYGTKNPKGYNNVYSRVTLSTNGNQTRALPNSRVYGTKNPKGYNNVYGRVTPSTNDNQTRALPKNRIQGLGKIY